jgi:hypothetical protein
MLINVLKTCTSRRTGNGLKKRQKIIREKIARGIKTPLVS